MGIPLTIDGVTEWRTPKRGGVLVRGVDEGLTGHGLNVLLIDDPVKDRLQAESRVYRDRLQDWARSVAFPRVEPGGSIVINMTRWHPDDLAGWAIKELGFESIVLPALTPTEDGWAPLWPERWSVEELLEIKKTIGPYAFESLYQGAPRPRDASVFSGAYAYDELPQKYRVAIGVDMAYSEKTSSDYSVAVAMAEANGVCFVLDVVRKQCRAPDFLGELRGMRLKYPGARMRWYAAGTEKGTADFFNKADVRLRLEVLPPKGDKFTRSIPYAAAWNAERICLPQPPDDIEAANWVGMFIDEHHGFTGLPGGQDDQVDAAAAAFDLLVRSPATQSIGMVGKRRM